MPWVIGAYCSAFAYATELSDATFSASAALMGAAMFALTSDIAARSGSSSPASWLSSSRVSLRYWTSLVTSYTSREQALVDRRLLLRVRVCDRPVGQDVRRDRGVDRD